jgi:DNA-binding GntR family transcriptional regulator
MAEAGAGRSKSQQVYEWIRGQIFTGALKPTARVNADAVSRELGVSKIPVREALQRLASEGLIAQQLYSGAVVAPLSWRELAGVRAARGALEPPAAALAAERADKAAITQLRANMDRMRVGLDSGDVSEFFELNRAFHLGFVAMSGFPVLVELVDQVLHKVSRYRAVLPTTVASARSDLKEHRSIVKALSDGDAARAEALVRQHVTGEHTITTDARRLDAALFEDSPDDIR